MISPILFIIWAFAIIIPIWQSMEDEHWPWLIWLLLSIFWIIPIFTGITIKNNEGQYKGYITAVEKNGTIFQGWNVYLKSDLTSSNEEKACINREDQKLIDDLKKAQEKKENITVKYEGVWQYPIGVCPNSSWMIIKIL